MRNNTLGNQYALTVLTPILPGFEGELRTYLEGLDPQSSPLARVRRTHFGRWVIVTDFVPDQSEPHPDELGCEYLLFSATLDGDVLSYLDELCEELGDEAEHIWGVCIGAPHPTRGSALKAYLLHNQIHTGLFYSAYPNTTVADVRHALELRTRAIAFAIDVQGTGAAALQQAFRAEFGV